MEWKDSRILVIGAGKSGIAAAKLLHKAGAKTVLYDGNEKLSEAELREKTGDPGLVTVLGEFPESLTDELDLAVISPGISPELPFVENIRNAGVPLIGELALAFSFEKGELLAVTGTNGKTTTTSLLGFIMKKWNEKTFVVGNIGLPYTEMVDQTDEDSVTVAEVSSFQLENAPGFHPHVSLILNITPDHLDRHHTIEEYTRVKESITKEQTGSDICVLNYEDEALRAFGEELILHGKPRVTWYSSSTELEKGLFLSGTKIICADGNERLELCDVDDLKLIGTHNYENVMAACAAAIGAGVPLDIIREALPEFEAVPHRIEFSGEYGGVRYYNDSKGTNPDAAIKAIQSMRWPTYLIGGGYDKGADYTEWIRSFDGKVKKLVLIGATKEKIRDAAEACGFTDTVLCDTFEEAFAICSSEAKAGEAVLLSPACASWGMFDNYEQRGDLFKKLASDLGRNR